MLALIVDDDEMSLEILGHALDQMGYEVLTASNGEEALKLLQQDAVRLVITDWEMPRMNGIELCHAIRREEFDGYIYVIMLTARDSAEQKIEGLYAGADSFIAKPLNPNELVVCLKTAERILALETRNLAIFALAKLAESRDPETGAHVERVQSYARLLAQHLSKLDAYRGVIDAEYVRLIYQTSPLHDIGKVGIPDAVLLKPGKLTDQEFAVMRTHTTLGARTLDAALNRFPNVRFLQMAREIAASHHEKFNGAGYPQGLVGEQIPLSARIVALADVYDALTSRRVYHDAMSHEKARAILLSGRGSHFDPNIVDAFLALEPQFLVIKERLKDEDEAPVQLPALPARVPPDRVGRPETVLVVDDDTSVCEVLENYLRANGIEALSASSAAEALQLFTAHEPRLVISDLEMPGMDGLELCRRIRALRTAHHVHFIMLTVHSEKHYLASAFDAGVDDFLSKPFNETELAARVRTGLRAVQLHDELSQKNAGSQQLNEQLTDVNRKLEKLAITDDLTGLFNRRQAMLRLEEQWSMSDRYHRPLAAVMVDIDHFKNINDTFGHHAGDVILRSIAASLRECVRTTDAVARIGGEEFLLILPYQTKEEAIVCAERCRRAVAAARFQFDGHDTSVTISLGIASRRADMTQCADLLKEADHALYAAKEAGRNTIRCSRAEPGTSQPAAA